MTWPELIDRHFNALWFLTFVSMFLSMAVLARALERVKKVP